MSNEIKCNNNINVSGNRDDDFFAGMKCMKKLWLVGAARAMEFFMKKKMPSMQEETWPRSCFM